jgi:hypothetical protein
MIDISIKAISQNKEITMKALKKLITLLTSVCLLGGIAMAATACDGEEQQSSNTGSSSVEDGMIEYTIVIQKEDGSPLSGVTVSLKQDFDDIAEDTTDENGSVVFALEEGTYSVWTENLPELHYLSNSTVTVSAENTSCVLTAIDNTPNGTFEKPFPLFPADQEWPNGTRTLTIPASTGVYYNVIARGTLVVESQDATVTYKGQTYTAVEGKVSVVWVMQKAIQ